MRTLKTPWRASQGEDQGTAEPAPADRCRAVVVTCIDYRFVEPLGDLLSQHGLRGQYDLLAWPGGAAAFTSPDRQPLIKAIALARELHSPSEVILVAHHDCGRLGGSARFPGPQAEIATLETALTIAGETVAGHFPTLDVHLVRLEMEGARSVGSASPARVARGPGDEQEQVDPPAEDRVARLQRPTAVESR